MANSRRAGASMSPGARPRTEELAPGRGLHRFVARKGIRPQNGMDRRAPQRTVAEMPRPISD